MVRLFKHYIPKGLFFLAVAELLILWGSIYAGVWLRFRDTEAAFPQELLPLWPKALVFTAVMSMTMLAMGLYRRNFGEGLGGTPLRLVLSFAVGFLLMSLLFYTFPKLLLGRGAFGFAVAIAFGATLVMRQVFLKLTDQVALKRRVLVLGSGAQARHIADLSNQCNHCGFTVVGFVPVEGEQRSVDRRMIIPIQTTLLDLVRSHRIDELVVAADDRRRNLPVDELLDCKMSDVVVLDLLTFFERETGKIKLDALRPSWMIFSDGFRQGLFQAGIKRVFDIVAALLLLAVTWPVMLITAAAILIEGRGAGPVLYAQARVGKNWQLFQVLKFRSMCVDAEKDGAVWACKDDDRITAVGRFIRKVRIDELPQIFNVLRGDMSFIGPRPERPMFVEKLSETIPYYAQRHRVKPGITGWAQINYQYGASEQDALEKLQYDLYYVKNYGLFLDLLILVQTVQVILWGKGAH